MKLIWGMVHVEFENEGVRKQCLKSWFAANIGWCYGFSMDRYTGT